MSVGDRYIGEQLRPTDIVGLIDSDTGNIDAALMPTLSGQSYVSANQVDRLAGTHTGGTVVGGFVVGDVVYQLDTEAYWLVASLPSSVAGNWAPWSVFASSQDTGGGVGNAGKLLALDANGKADGRDLATDGTKLDGIAAGAAALTSSTPAALGVAAVGVATTAARGDHVHAMPSAADVGADPAGTTATHAALTTAHGSTALNTASAIVQRDASGNFAAGTITASLTGTASGNDVVGAAAAVQTNLTTHINEGTVNSLKKTGGTARTGVLSLTEGTNITITDNGDGTFTIAAAAGGASSTIDGVSNSGGDIDFVQGPGVTITPNDGANTITFAIGQSVATSASPSFVTLTSTQATGTPPFTVSSGTVVPTLNVDKVDGFDASKTPAGNLIPVTEAGGGLKAEHMGTGTATAGYVLTANGANAVPSYQAVTVQTSGGLSGGGQVVYKTSPTAIVLAQNEVFPMSIGALTEMSVQLSAWYLGTAATNVTNSQTDFDAADEGNYTQEDAINGTDFIGGVVKLHCTTPNRVILLHGEGSDGSTTIDDDGSGGGDHTWSCQGNAQIDTAQYKWGSSSFLFDGAGDYLRLNATADMLFAGDFTISMWVRPSVIAGDYRILLCNATNDNFQIIATSGGAIEWYIGGGAAAIATAAGALVTGSWQYVQASRSGTTIKLYVDGVEKASGTKSGTIGSSSLTWDIGYRSTTGSHPWNGWIDEIMVNNGTALGGTSVPSGAWDSVDFPLTGYWVKTPLLLGLSAAANIDSLTITQVEPAGTTIRYLYTDDSGSTWKDHNGSTVAIADIHTSGATAAQMQTKFTNFVPGASASGWYLTCGLKTTDATVSPSVSLISFQYDEVAPYVQGVNGTDYSAKVWLGTYASVRFTSLRSGSNTWQFRAEIV